MKLHNDTKLNEYLNDSFKVIDHYYTELNQFRRRDISICLWCKNKYRNIQKIHKIAHLAKDSNLTRNLGKGYKGCPNVPLEISNDCKDFLNLKFQDKELTKKRKCVVDCLDIEQNQTNKVIKNTVIASKNNCDDIANIIIESDNNNLNNHSQNNCQEEILEKKRESVDNYPNIEQNQNNNNKTIKNYDIRYCDTNFNEYDDTRVNFESNDNNDSYEPYCYNTHFNNHNHNYNNRYESYNYGFYNHYVNDYNQDNADAKMSCNINNDITTSNNNDNSYKPNYSNTQFNNQCCSNCHKPYNSEYYNNPYYYYKTITLDKSTQYDIKDFET